eukprot:4645_1
MGCLSSNPETPAPKIIYDETEFNEAIAKLLKNHNKRSNVYITREIRTSIQDSIWSQFGPQIEEQLNAVDPPLSEETKTAAKYQFKIHTIDTLIDAGIAQSEQMISMIQFLGNNALNDLFIPVYGQNFIKIDLEKIPKKFNSALLSCDFKIETKNDHNSQIVKPSKYDVPYADFTKIDIPPKTSLCNNESVCNIYYRPNEDFSFTL